MHTPVISVVGLSIVPIYFLLAIFIGWIARKRTASVGDYLNASRSLPLWIVSAAFLSANCGALEVVGLSAMAAKYGVQAFHFYWIGAIPAMIFLALWVIPVYMKGGVLSVPEYLERRYSGGLRLLNACITAVKVLALAGINLFAMSQVLQAILGLSLIASTLLSALVVLVYVLLGGVRATIYNEVFQLLVMLAGLVPLFASVIGLTKIPTSQQSLQWHLWASLPIASTSSPFDLVGVVIGLGLVLSFSYWVTDFVLIQRALASRTVADARQVPLWAGFGKLVFSLIVVLPGIAAAQFVPNLGIARRYDQALPAMMTIIYGPTMLGLGLAALVASLTSGLAANISAFTAVWTEDIYRAHWQRHRSELHYLRVGYSASAAAMIISVFASALVFYFGNLMEFVQLIFSVFGAPFWAVYLLGMINKKTTAQGALAGFLSGTLLAMLHQAGVMLHWITYGSIMTANFHVAIYAFSTTLVVAMLASRGSQIPGKTQGQILVLDGREVLGGDRTLFLVLLSTSLLVACALLNFIWR